MTFKTFAAAGCAVAVALSAGAASAQQAPAAAAPAVTHAAPVPGLCTMSVEAAIAGSAVGKHVSTRMQQLIQQANAEVTTEQTQIQNEGKTLESQRATLDRTTLEQRAASLQVRVNALERKADQRRQELNATEQKAVGRIGQEMEPLIRNAYQQKGCSVLLNRNALVIANPANDITPQVVTALNAKITQFAFDRERLDAQPQATAARPAAATPAAPAQPQRR